jgi:hypothetical protein
MEPNKKVTARKFHFKHIFSCCISDKYFGMYSSVHWFTSFVVQYILTYCDLLRPSVDDIPQGQRPTDVQGKTTNMAAEEQRIASLRLAVSISLLAVFSLPVRGV